MERYPLNWPPTKPRTRNPSKSDFAQTLGKALEGLKLEVKRLGGRELIISSNLRCQSDGTPYANQREPTDRGIAVYFKYRPPTHRLTEPDLDMCFSCDRWNTTACNVWAIAKTIEALRGIARWGSGEMLRAAFTGFAALPAPFDPWKFLGLERARATREDVERRFRVLRSKMHPDHGATADDFTNLTDAKNMALAALEDAT